MFLCIVLFRLLLLHSCCCCLSFSFWRLWLLPAVGVCVCIVFLFMRCLCCCVQMSSHVGICVVCVHSISNISYVVALNLLQLCVCVCWQYVCYVLVFFLYYWATLCLVGFVRFVLALGQHVFGRMSVCIVRTLLQVCGWAFNIVPCLHWTYGYK